MTSSHIGSLAILSCAAISCTSDPTPPSSDLDARPPASCAPNAPVPAGACEAVEQDVAPYLAQTGPLDIVVDNQRLSPVVAPFIKIDRSFVEMASVVNALGASVTYEPMPVGRITLIRKDLKITMHVGYRWGEKYLRGRLASYFDLGVSPFLAKNGAQSLNKIVLPVSAVASLTGATVSFVATSTPRRVEITSGRTYFFDWDGAAFRGTYIQYTDARNQLAHGCPAGFAEQALGVQGARWCKKNDSNEAFLVPTAQMRNACLAAGQSAAICDSGRFNADLARTWRGTELCTIGAAFDDEAQACMEAGNVLGPFPAHYRTRCTALGYGAVCASNRWPKATFLPVLDTADVAASLSQAAAVDLLKSNPELFDAPNEQNEIVSAGLYSRDGAGKASFERSEPALPPFVLSARRQTDQMARAAYLLLPEAVRRSTGFAFVDRLAQSPDLYVPYLAKKQRVILMGTFMGLGGIKARNDAKHEALKLRHARELFKLRASITLVKAMGLQVADVLWSIGDTHTDDPALQALYTELAGELQRRYDRIMDAAGLGTLKRRLSYGGDELALVAFAQAAGSNVNAYVEYSSPGAKPRYDGGATTAELVAAKLSESKINIVAAPADAAIELYVISRPPDAQENLDSLPAELALIARVRALPAARRAKAYVVDMRYPNGAVNADMVLQSCDHLGFSGWGTGANAIGTAAGTAKLLALSGNRAVAKRLILEAVAYDVFGNGYREAQRGALRDRVNQVLRPFGLTYNHHPGYFESRPDAVHAAFKEVNAFVNERMASHFAGTGCLPAVAAPIRITAQLWRHFEAEVHVLGLDDGWQIPGLYRTGTIPGATKPMNEVLDPTMGAGAVTRVDLARLLAE